MFKDTIFVICDITAIALNVLACAALLRYFITGVIHISCGGIAL